MKALLSLDQARAHMLAAVSSTAGSETLALAELPGRILAVDVVSAINAPPADNSAMDGYAFSGRDLESGDGRFTLAGKALAGQPFEGSVAAGQCVRIMTGAVLPAGTDTVVMQENVAADGDIITINVPPKARANVRYSGEDIACGDTLFTAGHRLGPVDIGLLATLGMAEVAVKPRLKVAVFANGSELRPPGEALGPGEIYDSNRYFLGAMLQRLNCELVDLGVIPDDLQQLRAAYQRADREADVVITCGGASVGEADYTRQLLSELGSVGFWKVAIKPGKPFMFGDLGASTFFGLPGNPMSALVTFYQLVLPVLEKMQGTVPGPELLLSARASCKIKRNRSRLEFLRASLTTDSEGELIVSPDKQQSSGALSSFSRSNCFILLDAGEQELEQGERVRVQLFTSVLR
ncbi:MAG: molybdopterin molybdotransferase MoeA [Gammaproteobacteria bacterium]|nr:molybdopterin molybdotransferase MoeA [Gammaproteobacteria bacterium]MBQ0838529.1 molybdopterin molybdotransferase MoeA [Gammaproteobacteria bacterium]